MIVDDENNKDLDINDEDEDNGVRLRGGLDRLHISKKAVGNYGTIDGCPACEIIKKKGHQPGRLGQHHSQECRERITTAMQDNPVYQQLVEASTNGSTGWDTKGKCEQPIGVGYDY